MGFFSSAVLDSRSREAPPPLLPQCGACGLFKMCKSQKMPIYGKGKRGILVIGEAPGRDEDDHNRPFIGKAGQRLRTTARKFDVSLDRDCWTTNSLICRPPNNRTPTTQEIAYCRPNILRAIKELEPKVIILLGNAAVQSVIGHIWRESPGGVSRWAGFRIPCHKPNAWVCPAYHPSWVERSEDVPNHEARLFWFERHLKKAFELSDRPHAVLPNYQEQVQIVEDDEQAAKLIRQMIKRGNPIAFDYESTTLKPEPQWAQNVSCAVSDGLTTVAYPWHGAAIAATQEMTRSENKKIASNLKHEERWTRHIFGKRVRNWWMDTMLAAHTLDNRAKITSIKFQAFVHLGQTAWDDHIKPYLKSGSANVPNRIREVPIRDLLLYNGLDALLEWHVAMRQAKELGLLWR